MIIATILGFILGGLFTGLIFGMIARRLPPAVVSFIAGRRRKKFLSLLPDTLQLLSGTLEPATRSCRASRPSPRRWTSPWAWSCAGWSPRPGWAGPLEEALDGVAERMDSPGLRLDGHGHPHPAGGGGNLSELLLTVADTMTQRERLRRDVAALTAEGRISALVLACLPVGLGVLMYVINPDYMSKLFDDTLGNIMFGLAILGMAVGFLWMRSIINIEI